MDLSLTAAVYGTPRPDVAQTPKGARQLSPRIPGSFDLAEAADGTWDEIVVAAPPGAVEARYVLAQALRTLKGGGVLTASAPKDKGGLRIKGLLESFSCQVAETSRRHHRICVTERAMAISGLEAAIEAGGPRLAADGLWTQPGVFSWDRLDPGTHLLLQHLPDLKGRGADFGCGIGWLSRRALESKDVAELTLIDLDRRALNCARRNVSDPRARFEWADARRAPELLSNLEFVVMNPPFHDGGQEDRALGQGFIAAAAACLARGGVLWLTANRHLPYETVLEDLFRSVNPIADTGGFKIIEARR